MNLAKVRVSLLTILLFNSLFVNILSIFFLPLIIPAINIISLAIDVYNIVSTGIDLATSSDEGVEMVWDAASVNELILQHKEEMENLTQSIVDTKNLLIKFITLKSTLDKVTKYQYMILARYNQMLFYKEHRDTLENATLFDFAKKSAIPNGDSMTFILDMYHYRLLGPKDREDYQENIFTSLAKSHKDLYGPERTSKFMHSFYTDIVNTQLKGYSILEFSWVILQAFRRGKFTIEKMFAHEELHERLKRTERMFRKAITWKCQPPKEAKGKKQTEFQKLLEGFEKDEVIMFSDGSCMNDCADGQRSEGMAKEYCNPEDECKGRLYDCDYSGREPRVCLSPGGGKRSVDMVEFNAGDVEGKNVNCP